MYQSKPAQGHAPHSPYGPYVIDANCDLDDWLELESKNPVSILNELYPGILREYELRRNNFSENGNFRFESVSFSSFRIFCTDLRDVFRLVHKQIIK